MDDAEHLTSRFRLKRIIDVAMLWHWEGGLMRCSECGQALSLTRDGEPLRHSPKCTHADRQHPWQELREAIAMSN